MGLWGCLGASILAIGCTRTVTVPASEVPRLATPYGAQDDERTVRTVDGDSTTVPTTYDHIEIKAGPRVDRFETPNWAWTSVLLGLGILLLTASNAFLSKQTPSRVSRTRMDSMPLVTLSEDKRL